jgi:hypothetical protein
MIRQQCGSLTSLRYSGIDDQSQDQRPFPKMCGVLWENAKGSSNDVACDFRQSFHLFSRHVAHEQFYGRLVGLS